MDSYFNKSSAAIHVYAARYYSQTTRGSFRKDLLECI